MLKLVLAAILPAKGPKDKASIELAWRDQMDLRLAGYTCRRKAEQRQVKPDERSLQLRRA